MSEKEAGPKREGILYLCATPIGNLEDITLRVLRILKEVDLIAAEDTRATRKLLSHYDIRTPLTSYHEHNQRTKGPQLLERVAAGQKVAVVTDAGLPGISDPGAGLVQEAVARGLPVTVLPGPVAMATALVLSGLPAERFVFEGFLPRQGSRRRAAIQRLLGEDRTIILYEAPHRLVQTLSDLREALGERPAAVVREMTKIHEEVRRGTLGELLAYFQVEEPRGEITLVLAGGSSSGAGGVALGVTGAAKTGEAQTGSELVKLVRAREAEGFGRKEAIRLVSRELGLPRRQVYQAVIEEEKQGKGAMGGSDDV